MRRRDFIALAVGALAWPIAARAEEISRVHRILWLSTASGPDPFLDGFREGLRSLGYVEGKNVVLQSHYSPGNPQALRAIVSELKAGDVDLVVSSGAATRAMSAITDIPVLFARKTKPVTMTGKIYERRVPSRTKGGETLLLIAPEYLLSTDRVVIIDDFLASGQTLNALANMVVEAKARLLGFGVVVEKTFEHGRKALEEWNVPLESLVVIEQMNEKRITFR